MLRSLALKGFASGLCMLKCQHEIEKKVTPFFYSCRIVEKFVLSVNINDFWKRNQNCMCLKQEPFNSLE